MYIKCLKISKKIRDNYSKDKISNEQVFENDFLNNKQSARVQQMLKVNETQDKEEV